MIQADIYELLLGLLRKPEDDPQLPKIVELLGEEPRISDLQHIRVYNFDKSGIEVHFFKRYKLFDAVIFYLDIPSIRDGYMQKYRGTFLAGITSADSRESVQSKLGFEPLRWRQGEDYLERYDFDDYRLEFIFDPTTEGMCLVSVRQKEVERVECSQK